MTTAMTARLTELSAQLHALGAGYPRTLDAPAGASPELEVKVMGPEDRAAIQGLAESLSDEDKLALHSDIGEEAVLARWLSDIQVGRTFSLLAADTHRLAGVASLYLNPTSWTAHVGEIQIIVSPAYRGEKLAQVLANEVLWVAGELGLAKVIAQMPNDAVAAQRVFRRFGFQPVTLLPGFALAADGSERDLLLMVCDRPGSETDPGRGRRLPWRRG